jgi:hypothetical protein
LPNLLDAHESSRRTREEAHDRIALLVRNYWKTLESTLRVGAAPHPWDDHVLRELEIRGPLSENMWPPAYDYRCEPHVDDPGACNPQWNGYSLTLGPIPQGQWPAIKRSHQEFVAFAGQYLPELREMASQVNQAVAALVDKLEDLLLSRRVPGRCQFCSLEAPKTET